MPEGVAGAGGGGGTLTYCRYNLVCWLPGYSQTLQAPQIHLACRGFTAWVCKPLCELQSALWFSPG